MSNKKNRVVIKWDEKDLGINWDGRVVGGVGWGVMYIISLVG